MKWSAQTATLNMQRKKRYERILLTASIRIIECAIDISVIIVVAKDDKKSVYSEAIASVTLGKAIGVVEYFLI